MLGMVLLCLISIGAFADSAQWWKDAVIYQIYPRSFQDSNSDGIGDLRGLINRIPYLSDLGIDAIWLSPIHKSPNKDFGYDVADYYSVHPQLGSLQDFEDLIVACKQKNIRVILDLVVNHTSDQHGWFKQSRKSRKNKKRDWYIWTSKPNNWRSRLDESAWEYDQATGEYYMHSFLKEQPDLNWRHPEVRAEVKKIMRFWLDKGVAGFRLDLANYYSKDKQLRDNPKAISWDKWGSSFAYAYHGQEHVYDKNNFPELLEIYREMRQVADSYHAVLLGEFDNDDQEAELSARALGGDLEGLHLAFNFKFLKSSLGAQELENTILEWERALPSGAQPVYTLSNHDNIRHISRYGNSEDKARLAAMLLLTLKGTPVLYYGEEIGMKEAMIDWKDLQDPVHKIMKVGAWVRYAIEFATYHSGPPVKRDECRTPMQWSKALHAGFSNAKKPWVQMSTDFDRIHVAAQKEDPDSLLTLYKKLIHLRKENLNLRQGVQKIQVQADKNLLIYTRGDLFVALNMGNQEIELKHTARPKVILSTQANGSQGFKLKALEGIIWHY